MLPTWAGRTTDITYLGGPIGDAREECWVGEVQPRHVECRLDVPPDRLLDLQAAGRRHVLSSAWRWGAGHVRHTCLYVSMSSCVKSWRPRADWYTLINRCGRRGQG
jgi:hypothetical protein